jgi:hypothetical protein
MKIFSILFDREGISALVPNGHLFTLELSGRLTYELIDHVEEFAGMAARLQQPIASTSSSSIATPVLWRSESSVM